VPGQCYRAFLESDNPDPEFVFFVGWKASNDLAVFEDADGDLHVFAPDEIEIA